MSENPTSLGIFDLAGGERPAPFPRLARTMRDMRWRTIDTAPKTGAYLVANALGEVCPCQARDGQRTVSNTPFYADWTWGQSATHWMPLPPPPKRGKPA